MMQPNLDIYEEIVSLRRSRRRAVLVTIINGQGSVPSAASSKLLVRDDGSTLGSIGGGFVEAEACRLAPEVLKTERPRKIAFDLNQQPAADRGMVCGGSMELYFEPIVPLPTLFLFGAGQTPMAVYRVAQLAGFNVTVIDDEPEHLNAERFPFAERMLGVSAALLPQLTVDQDSYLVIMTRAHSEDMEILRWAITTGARYIGMIGSQRKVISIFKHLAGEGTPAHLLEQVHAPIGLDIGAMTPEEIAVSVVAELIAVRRDHRAEAKHLKSGKAIAMLTRVS